MSVSGDALELVKVMTEAAAVLRVTMRDGEPHPDLVELEDLVERLEREALGIQQMFAIWWETSNQVADLEEALTAFYASPGASPPAEPELLAVLTAARRLVS